MPVDFENLPFHERPDLTPYIIHLTKNTERDDGYSGFDNLVNILQEGEIWGTERFIRGAKKAVCFMDVPFVSLKYILNPDNCDSDNPRYEPFGIFITKQYAYKRNCRPVLYLSEEEEAQIGIPSDELWRVVRFEVVDGGWISWIHEREWRCEGALKLPTNAGVLVKNTKDAKKLQRKISKKTEDFKVKPRTILPLDIICQGLNIF